ncbi:hypothetical protein AB0M79_35065 [Polymorphospora sp. NPDC051019]|uniref:hypothetical protein n=1 Tax=Polymorphospora sp. NPDC051019 TaxID=3155725 RepID=UPI00341C1C68
MTDEFARVSRWVGPQNPPASVMPGFADASLSLARNDYFGAQLYGFRVWPEMFAFNLLIYLNPNLPSAPTARYPNPVFNAAHLIDAGPADQQRLFTLGVHYADGRTASNAPQPAQATPARELELVNAGGGGAGNYVDYAWRVRPLPPPGPVTFWCRWPYYTPDEFSIQVDATRITAVAEQAMPLWPV